MPNLLDNVRTLVAQQKYGDAVNGLRTLHEFYELAESQAQEMLEIALQIREVADKRRERERCDQCIAELELTLAKLRGEPAGVTGVPDCLVLGGGGLLPRTGERWWIGFTNTQLVLTRLGEEADGDVRVPYAEITALEIGGPEAKQSGGGFIGGGFGLEGAAAGMLIATALNLVTTRTSIMTVICLQTSSAELFLLNATETPDDLRMRLSPVFTQLRQEAGKRLPTTGQQTPASLDVIDRLQKLGELVEKGLLTEDEFAVLKAKLFATVDDPVAE